MLVGLVLGLVFSLVLATLIVPILAFTFEVVAVVVLFGTGLIGRLLLGRPWRVEAITKEPPFERREIAVPGLSASREAVCEIARDLEAGRLQGLPSPPTW